MDLSRLRLVERLGGTLLQAPGCVPLVMAERIARHGAPQVLVLHTAEASLATLLRTAESLQADGLDLNVIGVLDPGPGLPEALQGHRRRFGSLLCALDSGVAWPGTAPLLAKRLPGRIRAERPLPMAPARLSPLERGLLRQHGLDCPESVFIDPPWEPHGTAWVARWWPGVELPQGAEILQPGLELQTATPLAEALRNAWRAAANQPVPLLPLDADPGRLHALLLLCPDVQVFHGEAADWSRALANLAQLPAPPHFCARC